MTDIKKQGELLVQARDIGKVASRHVAVVNEEEEDAKDSSSLTLKAQPSRENRMLSRKSSIATYKFSSTNLTPFLRKRGYGKVQHASTVELIHNTEREAKETAFREQIDNEIKKVALELKIDINEQQVYNCQGVVEMMRRNKGIVVTGPQCSGKT